MMNFSTRLKRVGQCHIKAWSMPISWPVFFLPIPFILFGTWWLTGCLELVYLFFIFTNINSRAECIVTAITIKSLNLGGLAAIVFTIAAVSVLRIL